MKVAIVTDLHFGVRNNNLFFLEKQEQFFYETFIPIIEANEIETIIIMGDVFENRKHINTEILNRVYNLFQEFENRKYKIICLIGNHDIYYKNTRKYSSLYPLEKSFKNITLIKEFEEIELAGEKLGFISWITSDNKDKCLDWLNDTRVEIIFGHFEINDFAMVGDYYCKNGFNQEFFNRFKRVFSGHFHIKSTNNNISYLGNPYQTDWSDYGYEKGFHIYDIKKNELVFHKNPVSNFAQIVIDDIDNLKSIKFEKFKDKIVKIFLNIVLDKNNTLKLDSFFSLLNQFAHQVEVIDNTTLEQTDITIDIEDLKNTVGLMFSFIDNSDFNNLSKDKIKELSLDIYNSAREGIRITKDNLNEVD